MTTRETPESMSNLFRALLFLTGALVLLAVGGCASISPAPFTAFTTSVQQIRDGADASLGLVHKQARDRYISEAAAGDVDKIEGLLFTQPAGDPFGWVSPAPPLFLKAAQFREGVYRLNSVLVSYAGLLGQLASPDLVNPDTFEELAKDLNNNLRTSVQALGVSGPSNKEIAIFSTLGTAVFREYLKNKQRSSLLKALDSNQQAIQESAELGASAVRLTAIALRNEYNNGSTKLAGLIANPKLADSRKEAPLRDLVEFDEQFMKEMSVLRTLHKTYMALPAAHRELAAGLADPKRGLPVVLELLENARDLNRLRDELSKSN